MPRSPSPGRGRRGGVEVLFWGGRFSGGSRRWSAIANRILRANLKNGLLIKCKWGARGVVEWILQKLTGGTGKFYLDETKILRLPLPPLRKAQSNDQSLGECVPLLLIFTLHKKFVWLSVSCPINAEYNAFVSVPCMRIILTRKLCQ